MQKGYATFMSTERGFALPLVLAGILLLSLIGAGGYYYYQTSNKASQNIPAPRISPQPQISDETTKWKVYKDPLFEFEYPSDWKLEEKEIIHNTYVGVTDFTEKRVKIYYEINGSDYVQIVDKVWVEYETSRNRTIREIKSASLLEFQPPSTIKIEKVALAGIEWYKYTGITETTTSIVYRTVKEPKLYTIKVFGFNHDTARLEKILNSFTFTN